MSLPMPHTGPGECPDGHDLELHVDGELAEPDREFVEAHLDQCTGCHRVVAEKLAWKRRLHRTNDARSASAPEALRARLRLKLDAEPVPEPVPAREPVSARRFRWARPVPLAAGATALGLAALFFADRTRDDLARDLVARHSRPQQLDLQSDDPRVTESWLADKVDFRVHVPMPRRTDFSLIGARVSHVRDRAAVYLLYGDRQSPTHRVSVIVFDDPNGRASRFGAPHRVLDREIFTGRTAGYNLALWRSDELVYSVVADRDDEALQFVPAVER